MICLDDTDSSSADEYHKTNEYLPRTTSAGRKAKVVRKSRKSRKQKAFSFNCKQTSVGIQTDSNNVMIVEPRPLQSTCDNSTQTDDVIVINVSHECIIMHHLHASSGVPNRLFNSGHSGLLPAIRVSDVHSVLSGDHDCDTDSGHMSHTENKVLTAAAMDCDGEQLDKGTISYKQLSAMSVCRGCEEVNAVTVIEGVPSPAGRDKWQQSKVASIHSKNTAALFQQLSSADHGQLSRWTTATRLDFLEESDEGRVSRRPETFFASLETSNSQETAMNDVDVSGISALSSHKEDNLPLSSREMLSINSQTKSAVCVHPDVVASSSNNRQSQASADSHCHDLKVSQELCSKLCPSDSSGDNVSRPSVGTHRRVSKGSPQSRGKPRLSVGRKSLSRRRSMAVHDKHHPPTKISRPAAWLMNATKSSRNKVQYHCFAFSCSHYSTSWQ